MIIIGECIHVISRGVREAIEKRDKGFIRDMALGQVESGAQMLDLNIGPQRKTGPEVMGWMVDTIQEVTDAPLSLDTTNAAAIEAGLKLCRRKAMINSTTAAPERLAQAMPLAARYDANIIALTMRETGLPVSADARIEIAADELASAAEYGVPLDNIYFDPLVMTVNGCQEHAPEVIKATRAIKEVLDPSLKTICGLSNISNGAPRQARPILNRVFLVMMLGAGLDSAILDPFDGELMEAIRIIGNRDDSTPLGRLYLALYDSYASEEEFDPHIADMSDPEQSDVIKTIRVLENKTIYAHSYLGL